MTTLTSTAFSKNITNLMTGDVTVPMDSQEPNPPTRYRIFRMVNREDTQMSIMHEEIPTLSIGSIDN